MEVQINNLSKRYKGGASALNDINLRLTEGMFGLLGPNGAGKTTLMRILATLLPATSGTASVDGHDIHRQAREVRRILGYLPQSFEGYGNLTVHEYLDYMSLLKQLPAKQRRRKVLEVIEQVNLEAKSKSRIRQLSGGMKRRVGIAQSLLNDPRLLIVDEPTAGLDPEERVRFRNLLSRLSVGRCVILSTHIVEDIAGTCSRMAILGRGQLLRYCSPAELISEAQGRVWELVVSGQEASNLSSSMTVVTSVVSGEGTKLRVVAAQRPAPNAKPAIPTMEDAYMSLMQEVAVG